MFVLFARVAWVEWKEVEKFPGLSDGRQVLLTRLPLELVPLLRGVAVKLGSIAKQTVRDPLVFWK